MKIYITEIEIYDDDKQSPMLLAKLKCFDDETYSITIDDKIIDPDDLRKIADLLESDVLKNGIENLLK